MYNYTLVAMSEKLRQCNASLSVARRSGCPSSRWQDAVADILVQHRPSNASLLFVNVGANKGYNVAEFMLRFHRDGRLQNSEQWHAALLKNKGNERMRVRYGCGLCNACKSRLPRTRHHVPVEAHAIEMVDVNAGALRRLFREFKVPGAVHHLAMSNYTGRASHRPATAVGLEHFELGKGPATRRVPCTTLDAFAASHLRHAHDVALLSIDAEGQDALILEGAHSMIAAQRIAVLEFEFIARGFWRSDHREQRLLGSTLQKLEANGYRCFWQGESGALAPASGPYWCDAFQFKMRSNLVCSHLATIVSVFHRLSAATMGHAAVL